MDRALKEALIDVNDLDRDEGVFYANFSQEDEKGFFGRIFSGPSFNGEFKNFKEIDEKTCRVTINAEKEEAKNYERASFTNKSIIILAHMKNIERHYYHRQGEITL